MRIDLVVESTGIFESYEKAQVHLTSGAKRVVTRLTIDDRRDKNLTIDGKVKSVLEKLG